VGRITLAAVVALLALAPAAHAQAPVFIQFPDVDVLVGAQHFDTPPVVPKVGDTLWGNNGSPFCDPVCDPNAPSQQPQPFQILRPGNGSPPSGQFFSWRRCDSGCVEVQGRSTTDNTYVVKPEDAGSKLQFVVTLTNYDCGEVIRGGPDAGKQECRWTSVSATALTETVQQTAVVAVTTTALADGEAGTPYSQALAATGGTGPASFAVTSGSLPPGVTLSPGGQLSGTPTTAGSFTFTVQASAPGANPGSRTYTIGVTMKMPAAVGDGVTGVAYAQALAVTGAPGNVTFTVTAGQLPDGLSVSGSQIVGTPTKQGEFAFTLSAASGAVTASKQFTIKIAYPALAVGPATLPRAIRGVPYEAQLTVSGGTAPYTWGLLETALPSGLSLRPDGRILGTPRAIAEETLQLTFQVRDQYGAPAIGVAEMEYYGPVLKLARKKLVLPTGQLFRTQLEVTGGIGPYTFEVVGGKLPQRVALGKRGAVVARRAAPATRRIVVRVTDRLGAFAAFKVRIDVKQVTAIAIP
jgi:hypothetical protein